MKKLTKKRKELINLIDTKKLYPLDEAIDLIKKTAVTKFDSTVEIAFNLNVDTRHADQQIRGAIVLPAGTGKTRKILVLTKTKEKEAREAGADFVGSTDLIEKIKKENWFDFDIIVATPDIMGDLGKIGIILGPKKLMPNPKTGTVTVDVEKAINEIKKGKVEYKTDKQGNVHTILGKVSFDQKLLKENYNAIFNIIKKAKPAAAKGVYIKNVSLSTTMGPGIKIKFEN
ncbi:50S ribosomal protein L1 [Spiroplasma endosymbiont of Amphibalanus improvisus]|uniref:50S ribosomal protein L1 n=1 Tax=Spiroplasma endosymbiont of Amphibalanus improvisus TaxID=3066327 RepID=UPI00313D94C3